MKDKGLLEELIEEIMPGLLEGNVPNRSDMEETKLGWPFDYGDDNVWLFLWVVFLGFPMIIWAIFVILKWLNS